MNALKAIFQDQLTEAPKKQKDKQQSGYNSHLGWVFVCDRFNEKPKAIRTYRSLYSMASYTTYFTPNTFYRNDRREASALRWINAMSVDIDVKNGQNDHLTLPELLDRITEAGLETPSLIVKTPSGGFHGHWLFESPKRAFESVIKHFERIQRLIASAIQGDVQAVGAERWFRMPTEQNIVFQSETRISFDSLCDWYSIQMEEREEERKAVCVNASSVLSHPAIQKLLNGVEEGQRDNTCYTLALAFKAAGYDKTATERKLQEWNAKNAPAMRQIDIKRKVRSAFKPGAPVAPSSYWIRTLSGMAFTYQVWEEAKPRHERKYSHLSEWEEDILAYIRQRKGGKVTCSQRELCEEIRSSANRKQKISYSTLKRAISNLTEAGKLTKEVIGKGRGAVTTFTIQDQVKPFKTQSEASEESNKKPVKRNGANSNTLIDLVVGGAAIAPAPIVPKSSPVSITPTFSSPAPIPANVPDRFASALWNRGFRDGRFIFGAWGKVQLAFKAFSIPFKAIAASFDYLQLAVDAVGITVGEKGSNLHGNFQDQDGFYKYLYGTVKGLLANYRHEELQCFVEDIEGRSLPDLLDIRSDLEDQLHGDQCADREMVEEKLFELGSEISAAKRRLVKWQSRSSLFDSLQKYFEDE
ncbi:primase C-terminal domain-containing protein [Bacillus sp. FJAT-47783]|uniref:primase C-terminal domain-containing protein n=1 Tax=Bacillus sp. FJAT-47783 TaxID=2922712 RepID=UPI001FACE8CE|nr:primase C-terminal domain-containing protein [Bacillus sp. FJAT-47783]